MTTFKFIQVKPAPKNAQWIERDAQDIGEAIQDHHYLEAWPYGGCSCLHCWVDEEMKSERIHVRIYKDDQGKEYMSKIYTSGIYRSGGLKPQGWKPANIVRQEVAKEIGMSVEDLLFDNWNELEYPRS